MRLNAETTAFIGMVIGALLWWIKSGAKGTTESGEAWEKNLTSEYYWRV